MPLFDFGGKADGDCCQRNATAIISDRAGVDDSHALYFPLVNDLVALPLPAEKGKGSA